MRRAGLLALAVLVALAGTVGLIAFFQSRDDAEIGEGTGSPGVAAPEETSARLRDGNVVLTFRDPADGGRLRALAEDVAGPPDQTLSDAGQAVIVEREAGQGPAVVARAYRRRLEASRPDDPALREFVEFWLGQARVE